MTAARRGGNVREDMIEKAGSEFKTIIKYVASGGISYLIDVLLFAFFEHLLLPGMGNIAIILSTIMARIISTLCNYLLNSRLVFKAYDKTSLIKFLVLAACQMLVSAGSVYGLNFIFSDVNDIFIKVPVDVILMAMNYVIQRAFIFRKQ